MFQAQPVNSGLIEEMFCVPDIVNPFSVSTRSFGKQRLTLDLRHENAFIYKQNSSEKICTRIFDKGCFIVQVRFEVLLRPY